MIREITSISAVEKYLGRDCLLGIDLDHTTFAPKSYFGSIHWLEDYFEHLKARGLDETSAMELVLVRWKEIQPHLDMRLVEPEMKRLLRWMFHIPVVGATARDASMMELTVKQLKQVGVSFASPLSALGFLLETKRIKRADLYQGILFAGGRNKGELLLDFLADLNVEHVKRILLIDDNEEFLTSAHFAVAQSGYEFQGFLYTKTKEFYQIDPERIFAE